MSSLLVEAPGLLTTVQDLGRVGYGALGVSPSGAADPVALRLGNLLVGNEPGAAALEMTLVGGSFLFPGGAVIALAGADFGATLNGQPLDMWTPHAVQAGMKLALGPTRDYARCYLAVAGGIHVKPFLGSASTHLLSGLGGFEGRALRKGDVLRLGEPEKPIHKKRVSQAALLNLKPRKKLRVTDGPQSERFPEQARQMFFQSVFRVSEDSDRLGLRLEGPLLATNAAREMITEGVTLGAVQVTPSGQPIVLGVEQQTTGGYPKIANIIGVDLHRLGQLRPRVEIRFERTSLATARSLRIEQERLMNNPNQLFV
ncbi:MAG TPA: biotin-dependent carboxyltransferase family protein [Candidatus Sulfotelmatobacter sp.]|nr:biotin-dependent carboxyltransferase family protein [Candidatus Sulfotelmatobacter sp.]